jgi:hypothetical protein
MDLHPFPNIVLLRVDVDLRRAEAAQRRRTFSWSVLYVSAVVLGTKMVTGLMRMVQGKGLKKILSLLSLALL